MILLSNNNIDTLLQNPITLIALCFKKYSQIKNIFLEEIQV